MKAFFLGKVMLAILLTSFLQAELAFSYTANKVWISRLNTGMLRVTVEYTIPALKERRLSYVDFSSEEEANKFYWDIVRGADFFHDDPTKRRFENPPPKPQPW